jgi:hypothetical protein
MDVKCTEIIRSQTHWSMAERYIERLKYTLKLLIKGNYDFSYTNHLLGTYESSILLIE